MDIPLDREVMVTLLSPPPDFWSTDPPTVLAYRVLDHDLGWVIAGIGVGRKPLSDPDTDPPDTDDDDEDDDATGNYISLPPDKPWETVPLMEAAAGHELATPYTVYGAMAVYAGVGPGHPNATMSFSPPMTGSNVVLPPFIELADIEIYDEPLGSFRYATQQDAQASRASVFYREVLERAEVGGEASLVGWLAIDVIGEGGASEFSLPADLIDFRPPPTQELARYENSFDVNALGLRGTDFQAMVTDDALDGLEVLQTWSNRRSVVSVEWWHDATLPE